MEQTQGAISLQLSLSSLMAIQVSYLQRKGFCLMSLQGLNPLHGQVLIHLGSPLLLSLHTGTLVLGSHWLEPNCPLLWHGPSPFTRVKVWLWKGLLWTWAMLTSLLAFHLLQYPVSKLLKAWHFAHDLIRPDFRDQRRLKLWGCYKRTIYGGVGWAGNLMIMGWISQNT